MKKWMQKLVDQLDMGWRSKDGTLPLPDLSEERATLLYLIDMYNRHLFEIDTQPIRKVREDLDGFAKELIHADKGKIEKLLFRFRQFFASYRIDEFTYVQKTFDEFRRIIWDFVDQLGEDLSDERKEDVEIKVKLDSLREAVEANSIDMVKTQSREFIDAYVATQSKKEKRRTKRFENIRTNLDNVKKQLVDANNTIKFDHLTQAFNRRSFDDAIKELIAGMKADGKAVTMLLLDIDFFKKINDSYGHDTGDFILQECVKMLKETFRATEKSMVCRIGGEEFAILLPGYNIEAAIQKAEAVMTKIRAEVFIKGEQKIKFTVSMGIAMLQAGESGDFWLKRADMALYQSKHTGRNKYTVAASTILKSA